MQGTRGEVKSLLSTTLSHVKSNLHHHVEPLNSFPTNHDICSCNLLKQQQNNLQSNKKKKKKKKKKKRTTTHLTNLYRFNLFTKLAYLTLGNILFNIMLSKMGLLSMVKPCPWGSHDIDSSLLLSLRIWRLVGG